MILQSTHLVEWYSMCLFCTITNTPYWSTNGNNYMLSQQFTKSRNTVENNHTNGLNNSCAITEMGVHVCLLFICLWFFFFFFFVVSADFVTMLQSMLQSMLKSIIAICRNKNWHANPSTVIEKQTKKWIAMDFNGLSWALYFARVPS